MPYSVDDKCKKLAKCPEAAAIITEYSPGFTTDPRAPRPQRSSPSIPLDSRPTRK